MSIYKANNKTKIYKGDYKPCNIYKGGIKISGWRYTQEYGNVLTIANTYKDDNIDVVIYGATSQVGTGIKSFDNPYNLEAVENPLINAITVPYKLCSVLSLQDTIESIDNHVFYIKRINEYMFNGNEEIYDANQWDKNGCYFFFCYIRSATPDSNANNNGKAIISNKFITATKANANFVNLLPYQICTGENGKGYVDCICFAIPKTVIDNLSANKLVGVSQYLKATQPIVQYVLKYPITTDITNTTFGESMLNIKSTKGTTKINSSANCKVKIKTVDN